MLRNNVIVTFDNKISKKKKKEQTGRSASAAGCSE
jgi:hypothetical protein